MKKPLDKDLYGRKMNICLDFSYLGSGLMSGRLGIMGIGEGDLGK